MSPGSRPFRGPVRFLGLKAGICLQWRSIFQRGSTAFPLTWRIWSKLRPRSNFFYFFLSCPRRELKMGSKYLSMFTFLISIFTARRYTIKEIMMEAIKIPAISHPWIWPSDGSRGKITAKQNAHNRIKLKTVTKILNTVPPSMKRKVLVFLLIFRNSPCGDLSALI